MSASDPVRVAFVCVRNAGRSQMATAFAERERERRGLEDRIEILTGGTHPADHVHEEVVEAMREEGFDLSDRVPREIPTAELESCDYVATMGCSTLDLDASGVDVRDWDLEDPGDQDPDRVREIRDEIAGRVSDLFDELGTEVEARSSRGHETDGGLDAASQRRAVRERYARIATDEEESNGGGCSDGGGCCTGGADGARADADGRARQLGYSEVDVDAAGEANLGLGCGNPKALASLEPGETILDLGSGTGFDCFLAAREVGDAGRVLGVDMTPEMVERARENAAESGLENVEFRLGEIEHLPVADGSVDVVISNCVVNLSPDKPRVFREAYRAVRPGGRLAISDVVLTAEIPAELRTDPESVASCVAGASTVDALERMLVDAGFEAVDVSPKDDSDRFIREWDDDRDLSEFLVSASITGRKPAGEGDEGD